VDGERRERAEHVRRKEKRKDGTERRGGLGEPEQGCVMDLDPRCFPAVTPQDPFFKGGEEGEG